MFLVVAIEKSKEHFTVPINWVTGVHLADAINDGVNCNDICLAFSSQNKNKLPDFGIIIKERFDDVNDACYIVRPVKFFGKLFILLTFQSNSNPCKYKILLSPNLTFFQYSF